MEVPSHTLIGLGSVLGVRYGLIEAAVATVHSGLTAPMVGRWATLSGWPRLVGVLWGSVKRDSPDPGTPGCTRRRFTPPRDPHDRRHGSHA